MRYFGERILLFHTCTELTYRWSCCGLWFGVAFPSHVTGRKFVSSQIFLVYWKTENTSFYFYFSAYFSKLSFVWLVTTGDATVLMSQKTDSSPKPQTILSQHWVRPCWAAAALALFEKSLVLQWGKSHEHSDKYKKQNKTNSNNKVFSRNKHVTLSSSKATGGDWEALCAGLAPGHTTRTWAAPWCDRFWGCHVRTCHHFKPVSGCSSYFSNKLAYFTL